MADAVRRVDPDHLATELRDAYEGAFDEWANSEDAASWAQASADDLAS